MSVLQRCEHMGSATSANASVLADYVAQLVNGNTGDGVAALLPQLCRQIGQIDADDISREGSAKACAAFITTLAETCPVPLYSHLSNIVVHLETDVRLIYS